MLEDAALTISQISGYDEGTLSPSGVHRVLPQTRVLLTLGCHRAAAVWVIATQGTGFVLSCFDCLVEH